MWFVYAVNITLFCHSLPSDLLCAISSVLALGTIAACGFTEVKTPLAICVEELVLPSQYCSDVLQLNILMWLQPVLAV